MGIKRGKGQGTFIESVTNLLETFYGEVAQEITPWTPKAPRLPDSHHEHEPEPETESLPEPDDVGNHQDLSTEILPVPPVNPPPWSTLGSFQR
jgi:hypothetical protein